MLHRLSEGIVTVDADGVISVANDAAADLLGRGDLVGLRAADVLDPTMQAVLEEGERDGRLVLGGERALIARSTGTHDAEGKPIGATLLLRDHSELHAALREMDGAQSLTDGLRAQAHEFANSMHVVAGLLELHLVDEAREFIDRIRPGGALAVDGEATGLGGELAALLSVKSTQAKERGMRLAIESSGTVPASAATDLVTVLGNLIDNALDACAAGDRIVVAIVVTGGVVGVTVDDTGPGVPAELAASIFDEGVSTKGGSRRRGIGLALVRRITRRYGGTATVTASATGGARFTVTLPMAEVESMAEDSVPG